MISEVTDCQITELVVNAHGSEAIQPVPEDQAELAFRHLMRCGTCRATLPYENRGRFVTSYVLTLD